MIKKLINILKKSGLVILALAVFLFMALVGINLYVKLSVRNRIITDNEAADMGDYDCIIVLGAAVKNNSTPSRMLADRLDKACELYFAGCAPKLIMSGDHGTRYYDEVNVMKHYAMDKGIASENVFMDHAGFSTYETMYRAKEIFGAERVLIVTQEYHLYRAVYIAQSLGLEAYGVSAEKVRYSGQARRDVRELLARAKDFLYAVVKPKPTLLGDRISLDDNGNVTNDTAVIDN